VAFGRTGLFKVPKKKHNTDEPSSILPCLPAAGLSCCIRDVRRTRCVAKPYLPQTVEEEHILALNGRGSPFIACNLRYQRLACHGVESTRPALSLRLQGLPGRVTEIRAEKAGGGTGCSKGANSWRKPGRMPPDASRRRGARESGGFRAVIADSSVASERDATCVPKLRLYTRYCIPTTGIPDF